VNGDDVARILLNLMLKLPPGLRRASGAPEPGRGRAAVLTPIAVLILAGIVIGLLHLYLEAGEP